MNELHLVHNIPGRLRLRVPPGVDIAGLAQALAAEPGVTSCTWSARTRSLLVLYQPESLTPTTIADFVVRHTGLDFATDQEAPRTALPTQPDAGGLVPLAVTEGFQELDHRVLRATRGLVGLGGVIPLALAAWALREIVRGRTAPLVWSSALWYAHGLFRDYNQPVARD
jgi:hypothetical protein